MHTEEIHKTIKPTFISSNQILKQGLKLQSSRLVEWAIAELGVEKVHRNSQGGSVEHNKERYPKNLHVDADRS